MSAIQWVLIGFIVDLIVTYPRHGLSIICVSIVSQPWLRVRWVSIKDLRKVGVILLQVIFGGITPKVSHKGSRILSGLLVFLAPKKNYIGHVTLSN